jgi:hypothetical protein
LWGMADDGISSLIATRDRKKEADCKEWRDSASLSTSPQPVRVGTGQTTHTAVICSVFKCFAVQQVAKKSAVRGACDPATKPRFSHVVYIVANFTQVGAPAPS